MLELKQTYSAVFIVHLTMVFRYEAQKINHYRPSGLFFFLPHNEQPSLNER